MLFKKKRTERKLSPLSSSIGDFFKTSLALKELKPMPSHAARAFELAYDPTADFSDFVSVIEVDEALATKVIRLANSVYFSRSEPSSTIEQAVATIGTEELRCMLGASLLQGLSYRPHPIRSAIWANSLSTAILAKKLAPALGNIDSSRAFLCGVVHDIGKLVMVENDPDTYKKVFEKMSYEHIGILQAEEDIYELTHVKVGQWAAEEWNFPETVVKTITWHHESLPEEGPLELWNLIFVADQISHMLGIGHSPSMKGLRQMAKDNLPALAKSLKRDLDDLETLIEGMEKDLSEELEALTLFMD